MPPLSTDLPPLSIGSDAGLLDPSSFGDMLISPEMLQALAAMEPLVRGTLDNVFELGPVAALTGPVARGDAQVVAHQLAAMEAWEPRYRDLYQGLGSIALELAREQGNMTPTALNELTELLQRPD